MKLDAREMAAKFLAYRSRTVREMKLYLLQKGYDEDEIENVVQDFKAYGYLDDEKYCRQYFEYAFSKGKGKNLVFAQLKEKGVSSDVMQTAFEDFEDENKYDEKAQAREEAEKVLRMADLKEGEPVSEKLLAKTARRLQAKGYSSDTIYTVIGELRR